MFDEYKTEPNDEKILAILSEYKIVHVRRKELIAGRSMVYDVFDIGAYRTILTRSTSGIQYATCNCTGFYFKTKCKHTHYAIIKKGDSTPHGIATITIQNKEK